MNVKIISVQRHSQKEVEALEQDYFRRLERFLKCEIVTIRPKTDARNKERTLEQEEKLILKELDSNSLLIVLDERGKQKSSKDLSSYFEDQMQRGTKNLCFLIGGPQGVSDSLKKKADWVWALSELTLPHRLVRLFLIEALYRSFDMINEGPYHKI